MRLSLASRLSGLRHYVPMPLQLMATNIALTLCTFVTGVMLARALGPDQRGEFGALFMWTLSVANTCAFGTQFHLARVAAQQPEAARAVYRTAYRVALVSGLAGVAFYLLVAVPATAFTDSYDVRLVALAGLIILFSVPNAFSIQIELGRGRFASFNLVRALFALTNFVTVGVLFAIGAHTVPPFLIAVILTVLAASLSAIWSVRGSLPPDSSIPAPPLLETYRRAAPLGVTLLLSQLSLQTDKLLVSALFEPAIVGAYIVAATVAQVQFTIGDALAQMFFARAAQLRSADEIEPAWMGLRLRQTILIYAAVCCGATVVLPPLIPFIYGRAFGGASLLLYLLFPAVAVQGMARPFEETLRGLGRPRALTAMVAGVVSTLAVAGAVGFVTGDIIHFAIGVPLAFGAGLVIGATLLSRVSGIAIVDLLLPRPSDVTELLRQVLARWRARHG